MRCCGVTSVIMERKEYRLCLYVVYRIASASICLSWSASKALPEDTERVSATAKRRVVRLRGNWKDR